MRNILYAASSFLNCFYIGISRFPLFKSCLLSFFAVLRLLQVLFASSLDRTTLSERTSESSMQEGTDSYGVSQSFPLFFPVYHFLGQV